MTRALWLVGIVVIVAPRPARAELGAVSPGKLVRAHAALETQCNRCHVPFGGIPQRQCLACHTALAERTAQGIGFHAQVAAQPCTDCHKEHHGRDAALSPPPPAAFDHRATRFPLDGDHAHLACDRCHAAASGARRWVGFATSCQGCHVDRAHRGALGGDCARCHRASGWLPTRYAAAEHRTPLAGGHARLGCADCHRSGLHLAPQQACALCHAQPHGGTARSCETCHRVAGWKQVTYAHAPSRAALPGKHQTAGCLACHPAFRFAGTSQACEACHATERRHGPLGGCADCHSAVTWKGARFDHARPSVGFPLTGRHRAAACTGCHARGADFRSAPRACDGCHLDPHRGQFASGSAKRDRSSPVTPPSAGGPTSATNPVHAVPPGSAAIPRNRVNQDSRLSTADPVRPVSPATPRNPVNLTSPPSTAVTSTGTGVLAVSPLDRLFRIVDAAPTPGSCADCHTTAGWRPSTITAGDHAGWFALRGAHAQVSCRACHAAGGFVGTARTCSSCHPDARHRGRFGSDCASCHDESAWSHTERFDHARAGFALDGGHARVGCAGCHGKDGLRLAGSAAPTACQTCHAAPHGAQLGSRCTECHTTGSFRAVPPFDHAARTDFPLERRHAVLPCLSCHDARRRPAVHRACRTCHGDPHRGSNAFDCGDCHRADRWRVVRFDHDLTAYPLVGRHRVAACGGCHSNPNWTGVRTDCVACHALDRPRDAAHAGEIDCESCHTLTTWRTLLGAPGRARRGRR